MPDELNVISGCKGIVTIVSADDRPAVSLNTNSRSRYWGSICSKSKTVFSYCIMQKGECHRPYGGWCQMGEFGGGGGNISTCSALSRESRWCTCFQALPDTCIQDTMNRSSLLGWQATYVLTQISQIAAGLVSRWKINFVLKWQCYIQPGILRWEMGALLVNDW